MLPILYPLEKPIKLLEHHHSIPDDMTKIAEIDDGDHERAYTYTLLKHHQMLVFVATCTYTTTDGESHYSIHQREFPLAFLDWFPKALKGYRTPSNAGGPRPGALTSGDENVGGEMLTIIRTISGYSLVNRSRDEDHQEDAAFGTYSAMELDLEEDFIFDGGFLALIEKLRDQYARGEL